MKQITKTQHMLLIKHINKISGVLIKLSMVKQFVSQEDGKSVEEVILIATKVIILLNFTTSQHKLMNHYLLLTNYVINNSILNKTRDTQDFSN